MKIQKKHKEKLIKKIKSGSIFIYPTDTIYGLGCNALNKKSVQKIKNIKKRDSKKPLSIIAPSKIWIYKNLKLNKQNKQDIKKYLPGKYTLLLEKKNPKFLKHVSSTNLLGIRIPKNFFTNLIKKVKVPFITTSVNLSGQPFITNTKQIPEKILNKIDILINTGKLSGKPSTIIFPNGKKLKR